MYLPLFHIKLSEWKNYNHVKTFLSNMHGKYGECKHVNVVFALILIFFCVNLQSIYSKLSHFICQIHGFVNFAWFSPRFLFYSIANEKKIWKISK